MWVRTTRCRRPTKVCGSSPPTRSSMCSTAEQSGRLSDLRPLRAREQGAGGVARPLALLGGVLDEPHQDVADTDHPDEEVAFADREVPDPLGGHELCRLDEVVA